MSILSDRAIPQEKLSSGITRYYQTLIARRGEYEANPVNRYPIYIPSKGRSDVSLTPRLLEGLKYTIVCEPQDADAYAGIYGRSRLLVLDRNNEGIYHARNACKDHSRSVGAEFHWQLDDNISAFIFRQSMAEKCKKRIQSPAWVLRLAEDLIAPYSNIGGFGFFHDAFAFGKKRLVEVNKQIFCAVLMNNRLPCRYRPGMLEDLDMTLQILHSGYCTVSLNGIVLIKPATMSMKGGNTEIAYSNDGRKKWTMGIIRQWPNCGFKTRIKKGQTRIATGNVWSRFPQAPVSKYHA